MHLHFITLKRQTDFLLETIAGAVIRDSFTQVKNEWVLRLALPNEENSFLQLSCHPRFPFVVTNESINRQRNSTTVLGELLGSRISRLRIIPGERILETLLDKRGQRLVIHLFTTNSNFFLIDESSRIVNCFKKSKALKGMTYSIPENNRFDITAITSTQFAEKAKQESQIQLSIFLKKNFFHFNQTVLRELFFRHRTVSDTLIKDLSSDQLRGIYLGAIDFLKECEKSQPRIYFQDGLPHIFSLSHLKHLANMNSESFEDINSAIRFFSFQSIKNQVLIQRKNSYMKSLTHRIQYLENTSKKLVHPKEQTDKKAYYAKIAKLILAQPKALKKGATTADLVDYYDPQLAVIHVKINPKLNARENAEVFFSSARNFDEKRFKKKQRARAIEAQLKRLNRLKETLATADSPKALERITLKLKSDNLIPKSEVEARKLRLPFKKFSFKSWEIWIGRSAKDNDEMTFRHAHKEDWWLHVQGYSGSHVVIRNPGKHKGLPPDVLQRAASLAITNSDAKHASYVPVVYTKVKFVRKPRKSAPGNVVPSQTKTIYADPMK
jgi:predicted ribosome quality control (RQC) complex YloA/Tae2 family protein